MSVEARTGQRHQALYAPSVPRVRATPHPRGHAPTAAAHASLPTPSNGSATPSRRPGHAPADLDSEVVVQPPPRGRARALRVERRWAVVAKRTVDLAVGIPLLAVMVLAYPWIALALKLTSRGPVLFRQVRIGQRGQPIIVYKFRSMHHDAEARLRADPELYRHYLDNGFKVPPDVDPRITVVGRFLRRSSLDELPQAVCLVRGTMSVVGPRPVVPAELRHLYGDDPQHYLACKPGLTGLWQTSGRSHVVHDDRARLDAEYATHWSLRRDLQILARTIPVVLSTEGAH